MTEQDIQFYFQVYENDMEECRMKMQETTDEISAQNIDSKISILEEEISIIENFMDKLQQYEKESIKGE